MKTETKLLESYNSLEEEIQKLVKEKRENEKLVGTKFEEQGKADTKRIDNRLQEIHPEKRVIEEEILGIRKKNFEENFLLISKECEIPPVKIVKASKVDLVTYTKKAAQNLNDLYLSSEVFRQTFLKYSKSPYYGEKDELYFDLFTTPKDYPYSLILKLKDNIFSFGISGYGDVERNDYSEDSLDSDILQQKLIIKIMEEKESTIKFFFKKFWEEERRIKK